MLSIIIPVLNEEKLLPILLKEIKKQTRQNFASQNLSGQDFFDGEEDKSSSSPSLSPGESSVYEIIVADANSKDKTVEIAKNFGCKIAMGGSPAKGRNEGAKIAEGSIFLFMDADNIYLPENFFENILREFRKRNLGVASFPIEPDGKKIDRIFYGIYNNFVNLTQIPLASNSVLVKKEIFEKIAGFDEEIRIGEDHDFVQRAARLGKFGFIKTEPVLTSARRLENDGRLKTYLKYILAGIHIVLLGPIKTDIFKYNPLKNKAK